MAPTSTVACDGSFAPGIGNASLGFLCKAEIARGPWHETMFDLSSWNGAERD